MESASERRNFREGCRVRHYAAAGSTSYFFTVLTGTQTVVTGPYAEYIAVSLTAR
jgi:hypothetical protein